MLAAGDGVRSTVYAVCVTASSMRKRTGGVSAEIVGVAVSSTDAVATAPSSIAEENNGGVPC